MEKRDKTPSKRILQSIQNKFGVGETPCEISTNWVPDDFSTPTNQVRVVKNPFEPLLHDLMHTNIMSPSVFAPRTGMTPKDKFCWSIEEMASIKPIDIEKSPFVQSEVTDYVLEAVTQAKINTFFSAKTILPSPAGPATCHNAATPTSSFSSHFLPPAQTQRHKLTATTAAQTALSLPPVLPPAVERALRPYMQHCADARLQSKLYPEEGEVGCDSSSEEVLESPRALIHRLSPLPEIQHPLDESLDNILSQGKDWTLSPIAHDPTSCESSSTSPPMAPAQVSLNGCAVSLVRSRRSVAKLDFTAAGHMSVDTSQQLGAAVLDDDDDDVDDLEGVSFHNNSLHLGNTPKKHLYPYSPSHKPSSLPSSSANSSFCRMEDDYVTFRRSRSRNCTGTYTGTASATAAAVTSTIEMDVSFANTPRSRSASAARKRLCDSFVYGEGEDSSEEEAEEEEEEEVQAEPIGGNSKMVVASADTDSCDETESPKKRKPNIHEPTRSEGMSALTDTGYNTGSTLDESTEKSTTLLFASTPTKRLYANIQF